MSYQILIMISDPTMVCTRLLEQVENISEYKILEDKEIPSIYLKGEFGKCLLEVDNMDIETFQNDYLMENDGKLSESVIIAIKGRFTFLHTSLLFTFAQNPESDEQWDKVQALMFELLWRFNGMMSLMGEMFDFDGHNVAHQESIDTPATTELDTSATAVDDTKTD